jgi:hypothetical protein
LGGNVAHVPDITNAYQFTAKNVGYKTNLRNRDRGGSITLKYDKSRDESMGFIYMVQDMV